MLMVLGTGVLILLIVVGMPVGFALGVAGVVGVALTGTAAALPGILQQVVHETASSYVLLTIPMFVLMAEFLSAGGLAQDLMIACNHAFRKLRGGLAIGCVIAGAVLAAASGSSTASVATMTKATFPTMRRLGYKDSFALGTISISGTLAILIPPSISLIVYGIIAEQSIGKLFIAGIIPGILTAIGYIITISICARIRPDLVPKREQSTGQQAVQRGRVWPVGLLVTFVIGALYSGIATPTEISALGALGALLLILVMNRLSVNGFTQAVSSTIRTSVLIITIIFGAMIFGKFMTLTQVTPWILGVIDHSGASPYTILFIMLLVYIVLGMFMDQMAILVLTVPITYPIITALGFDGIWFGIIIVKTAEIGLVTPPVGLNVFIAAGMANVDTKKAFAGVTPFVMTEIVMLIILAMFPQISLWLTHFVR